jgi:small-conductance mechanosensitive channel
MDGGTDLIKFIHPEAIPYALLIIVGALVLNRLVASSLDALGERLTERRLQLKNIAAVSRFAVIVLATVVVVGTVFRLSEQVMLTIGGTAAVAIGFAFKDLLASLMAGIILLFDRPFQVGDRVAFAGEYGEVLEIGLRTVRIATLDDNLISIPNNRFLSDVVSSANAGALDQMCVFTFWIGCNEDFDLAKSIVYEACAASRYVYLEKPISVALKEGPVPNGAERFAIQITAKAYVLDGRYETAFGTDVTERVLRAFRAEHIRTAGQIEWGPPGSGAPPVRSKLHP